jgi:hypothetical protein
MADARVHPVGAAGIDRRANPELEVSPLRDRGVEWQLLLVHTGRDQPSRRARITELRVRKAAGRKATVELLTCQDGR